MARRFTPSLIKRVSILKDFKMLRDRETFEVRSLRREEREEPEVLDTFFSIAVSVASSEERDSSQ